MTDGIQLLARYWLDRSVRWSIADGDSPRAVESLTIVLKVGLTSPRSSMLMKVRSELQMSPNSSWDSSRLFRSCRNTSPNALSGPDLG